MSSRVVSCPNCGGTVEFKAGSTLLSVCPYCSSAVARVGDDITELEILGQAAPLADLGSPLAVGVSGRFGRRGFTLVGHVQYDHGAGPWNEWHAAFDDGAWGWVAEAQGRVYLTFAVDAGGLPGWFELPLGARIDAGGVAFTVVERRSARFVSAEGEIPFAAAPGAEVRYADLQGGEGRFGTIDFSPEGAAEQLFLGQELAYDQLFDRGVLRDVSPGQAAAAVGLNCPNCGASVEIQAPDEAKRITCGSCDSLLDCEKGSELHLMSSAAARVPQPLVPLGAKGKLEGVVHTVYGQLVKSVEYDGDKYLWSEYLLRCHEGGWRWLVESDGHWSFVEPVDGGADLGFGRSLKYEDRNYLLFSSASARVEGLRGEFYWKVAVGDRVGASDYVRPPYMLSQERTDEELVYSKGTYLEPAVVEEAFGLEGALPKPAGIAPHQPNPHGRALRRMLRIAVALSALVALLAGGRALLADRREVSAIDVPFEPLGKASASANGLQKGRPLPTLGFELDAKTNLAVRVNAPLDNGVLYLDGTLRDGAGTTSLGIRLQRYGGYSGGEAWSSGARARTVFLGQVGPGPVEVRLVPEFRGSPARQPARVQVKVVADVFIGTHAMVAGALLWVLPMLGVFRYFGFEKRRWSESDFAQ